MCNFIGDINRIAPVLIANSPLKAFVSSDKVAYVRNEKVNLAPIEGDDVVRLKARIVDREYYGLYSKYVLEMAGGGRMKTIEKENGRIGFAIGEETDVYIRLADIMQFDRTEREH